MPATKAPAAARRTPAGAAISRLTPWLSCSLLPPVPSSRPAIQWLKSICHSQEFFSILANPRSFSGGGAHFLAFVFRALLDTVMDRSATLAEPPIRITECASRQRTASEERP